jgi:hypothetical protein
VILDKLTAIAGVVHPAARFAVFEPLLARTAKDRLVALRAAHLDVAEALVALGPEAPPAARDAGRLVARRHPLTRPGAATYAASCSTPPRSPSTSAPMPQRTA